MKSLPLTKADLASRLIHKVNTYYAKRTHRGSVLVYFFLSTLSTNENASY